MTIRNLLNDKKYQEILDVIKNKKDFTNLFLMCYCIFKLYPNKTWKNFELYRRSYEFDKTDNTDFFRFSHELTTFSKVCFSSTIKYEYWFGGHAPRYNKYSIFHSGLDCFRYCLLIEEGMLDLINFVNLLNRLSFDCTQKDLL